MKEDSQRLLVFILLSVSVLAGWSYLFPPPKPKLTKAALKKGMKKHPKQTKASKTKKQPQARLSASPSSRPSTSQPAARSHVSARLAPPAKRTVALPKAANKVVTYKNKLLTASVSTKGGVITKWLLSSFRAATPQGKKGKKGTSGKPNKKDKAGKQILSTSSGKSGKKAKLPRMDRINAILHKKKSMPFSERLADARLVPHKQIPYQSATQTKPGVIVLTGRVPAIKGGYVEVKKTYTFQPKAYHFKISYELINRTKQDIKSQLELLLQDAEAPEALKAGGMFSFQTEQLQLKCKVPNKSKPETTDYLKLQEKASAQLKKNPNLRQAAMYSKKAVPGNVGFVAIDRRYFVMSLMPAWGKGDRGLGCTFTGNTFGHVTASIQNAGISISPGKSQTLNYSAYFGPKYYNTLKAAGAKLETTIDFGMFAFLSKPMLWTMQFFYDMLKKINFGNWGLAIIILTLLVKLLLWPLTHKSMESMKKMQRLKPEMDKLKEKYGDDKETIQRETMNLYVKHGINPISGCLPMLLQMPIWLALYQTILYSVELYQAPFIPGWIDDLSAKDPFFILPVLLGASMLLQHKLTPQTMDETQAKIMGMVMPVFFTIIMLFLPAGLTLYIFINTILGIAHQWHIYNAPDPEPPANDKKNTKKGWMQRMQSYVEEQQKLQQDQKKK
jgi:YidC/Oxa1 family membrane protein insertase